MYFIMMFDACQLKFLVFHKNLRVSRHYFLTISVQQKVVDKIDTC